VLRETNFTQPDHINERQVPSLRSEPKVALPKIMHPWRNFLGSIAMKRNEMIDMKGYDLQQIEGRTDT